MLTLTLGRQMAGTKERSSKYGRETTPDHVRHQPRETACPCPADLRYGICIRCISHSPSSQLGPAGSSHVFSMKLFGGGDPRIKLPLGCAELSLVESQADRSSRKPCRASSGTRPQGCGCGKRNCERKPCLCCFTCQNGERGGQRGHRVVGCSGSRTNGLIRGASPVFGRVGRVLCIC
ncbi:hypothetical protein BT67DRAFT_281144 [Trichocladium antarcticum]|uniref:Uncharacterized protein n=1 Tax=Trichocladium antarcticum TaxID=1450529 RepID=A0AAN6ZED7_9PEZI|nr:hypothetical protein BT67DRAFT_281144 [Trichocladium antarcticum]